MNNLWGYIFNSLFSKLKKTGDNMKNNNAITMNEITPVNEVGLLHLLRGSMLLEKIQEDLKNIVKKTEPGWCVTDCITAAPPSCS